MFLRYQLCCKNTNITDIYIGSTTAFRNRKYQHKQCCNNENGKKYNKKAYQFIRNNGNFENWDMIEIEKYKATDKRELEKRERYWIDTLKPSLNIQIPTQTIKEWYEINKDKIKEKAKEYYEINKDKIKEYRENNKDKRKEYYQENKDKIKEKTKKYKEKNKEHIKEINKQKINCDCGGKYTHTNKASHMKTKKHIDYINKNNKISL